MPFKKLVGLAVVVAFALPISAMGQTTTRQKSADAGKDVLLTIASVNQADAYGSTPLHKAVESGDLPGVERLIRAGANVNAANRYRVTPLSIAALHGDTRVV